MHRLTLEMNDQEGALLRLLGTTERRGWRSVGVNASARDGRLTVTLTVRGDGQAVHGETSGPVGSIMWWLGEPGGTKGQTWTSR